MYEKYSGLPDTTKPASQNTGRSQRVSSSTGRYERGNTMDHYGERGGSGRSGGGNGSRSSRSKKKKAMQRRRTILAVSSFVLLALLVGAVVIILKSCNPDEPVPVDPAVTVYRSGVYINGTDVSGKTIGEVREQLQANEDYAINNISITLQGDGFSTVISGADMGVTTNLDSVMETALSGGASQVYYTEYSLDEGSLAQRIDEINSSLTSPPKDASFTVEISDNGKPSFNYVDGQAGFGIDVESTKQLVLDAFHNKQLQTTLQPKLTSVAPSVTVDTLKAHTTLIGSYTTTYDFKGTAEDTQEQREVLIPNRAFNVEKAAGLINNQVIKPGRTWSFNDTVGDRNEKNGWKEANGIFGGDKYTLQYGGGVCQVSTTLYNALLECYPYCKFARKSHSIPSTYVDKGLDATVDTGHIDFKVTNQSEYPLYIFSYVSKNKKASGRKRDINVLIYGEALPAGITYQTHTEVVSETLPGEEEITETNKLFIGEEQVTAEARNTFVIDVYVDRVENGKVLESIFLYTDTYDGNPLRKRVGTKPTPTPIPTNTPVPAATDTPAPAAEDQP